jgi:hypothetical protein
MKLVILAFNLNRTERFFDELARPHSWRFYVGILVLWMVLALIIAAIRRKKD